MKAVQTHSTSRVTSAAASTNATLVKAGPVDVIDLEAYNTTASVKYLKLYNKLTTPVPASDTPFLTFTIPPNGRLYKHFANGVYFPLGLGYALTGGNGDSDNTALTAGDVVGLNIIFSG